MLLITGGSSYLGQHLVPLASRTHQLRYTYFSNDPLGRGDQLDLRDGAATMRLITALRPTAILHLAGSNRTPDMEEVIVAGARHVRAGAEAVGARLIHLSTDVIFDGTAAPYAETATPTPIHAYGRAKADAEQIIADYANHVIVRTSLIYSYRKMDGGTTWMAQALGAGETITLFTNHWRNPVHADDLGQACLELAAPDHAFRGVLNVAGARDVTRADFAQHMLEFWQINSETAQVQLAPDETGRFPRDCRLAIGRAQALLKHTLRGVELG